MGQHLHLYASKEITKQEADLWGNWRSVDLIQSPSGDEKIIFDKVDAEMSRLRQQSRAGIEPSFNHIEHWAAGGGVACFGFLIWCATLCNEDMVRECIEAGRAYKAMQVKHNPGTTYAKHDWENDDAIQFLKAHIGFVVWGDNDGV